VRSRVTKSCKINPELKIYRNKSSLSSIKVVGRIRDHQADDALRVWKDDPPHGDWKTALTLGGQQWGILDNGRKF